MICHLIVNHIDHPSFVFNTRATSDDIPMTIIRFNGCLSSFKVKALSKKQTAIRQREIACQFSGPTHSWMVMMMI
jgi:hypothetical protein